MDNYTSINASAIDSWIASDGGWTWGIPVSKEECAKVRNGDWNVLLTPEKFVPKEWFLPFVGAKILGLASGGGQQMPIFSILGASCVVMDLSDKQLESERLVAEREGYSIDIVKADMTKIFPFNDGCFDLIFHPVANVYVEDVQHIWQECYRVLRPGGVLLSGLDNGLNFIFDDLENPLTASGTLPYNPLKNPEQMAKIENPATDSIQFSHTFDEQIAGQLKAGFVITAAYEDFDRPQCALSTAMKGAGISSYWATRAVKQIKYTSSNTP